MSALGDILQSFPVMPYLHSKFPGVTVDWLVEKRFSSLASSIKGINEILSIDTKNLREELIPFARKLRSKRYDVVFDLQGNCKSGLMCLLTSSKQKVGFSRKQVAEWPNLLVTNKKIQISSHLSMRNRYLKMVQSYFDDMEHYESLPQPLYHGKNVDLPIGKSCEGRILVAPFSKWENKEIPIDLLSFVLSELEKEGFRFCILYQGKQEENKASMITSSLKDGKMIGNLSLIEVQSLASKALGAICADSALLHLFSLVHLPLFSLFGPSSAIMYAPQGDNMVSFQGTCPYLQKFEKRCSRLRTCKNAPCMKKLPVEHLLQSLKEWIMNLRGVPSEVSAESVLPRWQQ